MFRDRPWSRRIFLVAVLCAAALLVIRLVWLKPYEIPSPSMAPTLEPGDCILVNKLAYLSHGPVRGDIVVFKYPLDPARVFIKRVVALEGENFEVNSSQVYINGIPWSEPYLAREQYASFSRQQVPTGCLLVLGDNRNHSRDSRDWGMLPKANLLGKAIYIYSPVRRMGALHRDR